MAGRASPGASLVARALAVLGAFDEQHRRLRLTTIAERSGLSPATTLRIVRELVAGGALDRGEDKTYVIGRRLWTLGLLSPTQTGLRDIASPYLHDIHAATRATVHLAVRDACEVLYLDRISGQASVPVVSRVGGHLPLHTTGVGKALLAWAPADVVEQVMRDLTPRTAYTVSAPGRLARELAQVRQSGYATTREEMTLGACSVAVPVRLDDAVVAAIGVVVPDFRRDRARLIAALTMASRAIGRELTAARGSRDGRAGRDRGHPGASRAAPPAGPAPAR